MIKISLFCLLNLSILSSSCTFKVNKSENKTIIAPKTILYESLDYPSKNYTLELTFDGNKIQSIFNAKEKTKTLFIYSGDFITTKKVIYENSSVRETNYLYENNKLKEIIYKGYFSSRKYSYKGDQMVFYVDHCENPNIINRDNIGKFIVQNGNIVEEVEEEKTPLYQGELSGGENNKYSYDDKNHPMKNVLGFNLLLGEEIFSDNLLGKNNVIKTNHTSQFMTSGNRLIYTLIINRMYTYNKDGYPVTEEYSENGKKTHHIIRYVY